MSRDNLADADGFLPVLLAHAERLRQYIDRQIPERHQSMLSAEDVLQEVWVTAAQDYPPDHAYIDRWLIRIARSKLLDALTTLRAQKRGGGRRVVRDVRERQTSREGLFARVAGKQKTPSRLVSAQESRHRIQIALAGLPEEHRTVVHLRHIEGCSVREIAGVTAKTEGAVRRLLRRGFDDLRIVLGDSSPLLRDG